MKKKRYLIPTQIRQRMVYSGVSHKGSNVPPPGAGLHFTTPSCSCSRLNPQSRLNATQKHVKRLPNYDNRPRASEVSACADYFQVFLFSILAPVFSHPNSRTSRTHSKSYPNVYGGEEWGSTRVQGKLLNSLIFHSTHMKNTPDGIEKALFLQCSLSHLENWTLNSNLLSKIQTR